MKDEETGAADDRSLGGEDGDARSVSTLDIADVSVPSASPTSAAGSGGAAPEANIVGSNPGGTQQQRKESAKLQVEEGEGAGASVGVGGGEGGAWRRWLHDFQCDMRACSIAFVGAALLFVVVVVATSFAFTPLDQEPWAAAGNATAAPTAHAARAAHSSRSLHTPHTSHTPAPLQQANLPS